MVAALAGDFLTAWGEDRGPYGEKLARGVAAAPCWDWDGVLPCWDCDGVLPCCDKECFMARGFALGVAILEAVTVRE